MTASSPSIGPRPSAAIPLFNESKLVQEKAVEVVDIRQKGNFAVCIVKINGSKYMLTLTQPNASVTREQAIKLLAPQIDKIAVLGIRYLGGGVKKVTLNLTDCTLRSEGKGAKTRKIDFIKFGEKLEKDTKTTEKKKTGEEKKVKLERIKVARELFEKVGLAPPKPKAGAAISIEEAKVDPASSSPPKKLHGAGVMESDDEDTDDEDSIEMLSQDQGPRIKEVDLQDDEDSLSEEFSVDEGELGKFLRDDKT